MMIILGGKQHNRRAFNWCMGLLKVEALSTQSILETTGPVPADSQRLTL